MSVITDIFLNCSDTVPDIYSDTSVGDAELIHHFFGRQMVSKVDAFAP